MDEILGYFIETMNKNTSLFVVSDHGFMGAKKIVKINKFLKDNGYLKVKKVDKTFTDEIKEELGDKKSAFLSKIGLNIDKILRIMKTLRIEKLRYYAPKFIKSKIPISFSANSLACFSFNHVLVIFFPATMMLRQFFKVRVFSIA